MAEGFINIFAHISGLKLRSRSGLAHLQVNGLKSWGSGRVWERSTVPLTDLFNWHFKRALRIIIPLLRTAVICYVLTQSEKLTLDVENVPKIIAAVQIGLDFRIILEEEDASVEV